MKPLNWGFTKPKNGFLIWKGKKKDKHGFNYKKQTAKRYLLRDKRR
jgi:hypothetical protein